MALSNWLTRDEWNAVYFAGMRAVIDGETCDSLGNQMRLGIAALHRSGYRFRGINADKNGCYEKVVQVCAGNERCLAEMMDGTFDRLGRARELLRFADAEPLRIDLAWLREAVEPLTEEAKKDERTKG